MTTASPKYLDGVNPYSRIRIRMLHPPSRMQGMKITGRKAAVLQKTFFSPIPQANVHITIPAAKRLVMMAKTELDGISFVTKIFTIYT